MTMCAFRGTRKECEVYMKKYRILSSLLAFTLILLVVFGLMLNDVPSVWNSWGKQEDGGFIYPTFGFYSLLVLFKMVLYFIPSLIIAYGWYLDCEKNQKYICYLMNVLNYWFLSLLTIKLLSESVFELDRIFGLNIFNSIKDIQTLIGYIITLLLKKNYKIEPKINIENKDIFTFSTIVSQKYKCDVTNSSLKKIYKPELKEYVDKKTGEKKTRLEGTSTDKTKRMGVYALYYEGRLMKIGKAVDGGMFKRMGQYYRADSTGGLDEITNNNRDLVEVEYFNLDTPDKCWAAERFLQSEAFEHGEEMPWENKTRN